MMASRTPRLEIRPDRIKENAVSVIQKCHQHGAAVACVTKVVCAHPAVVMALAVGGADILADARLPNLESIGKMGFGIPTMLLGPPAPSRASEVVATVGTSLNSSLETMFLLSEAAGAGRRRHQIIVMIDLGDLREGIRPDQAIRLLKEASRFPNLDILGLGCNLACFGGVLPTAANMQLLISTRDACRRATGLELGTLSGGNSASLPLLESGRLPQEINQLRIGEAILLGRNVVDSTPLAGTRQDTFRLVAEVVEVGRKPSMPIGERGLNAFGEISNFEDRGIRLRALCNLGRQDVAMTGITPEDRGIRVLGGSSDHLILDVEEAETTVQVGMELGFRPNYGALLALATSPFVGKVVLHNGRICENSYLNL